MPDSSNNADDLAFSFDAYEQVVLMARGNLAGSVPAFDAEFAYGPDRSRYRRIDRQNVSVVRTTRYIGNVEFILESGVTRVRRHLAGGAVVTTASSQPGVVEDRWVLTDHLGSSDVVVNDAGVIVESSGFDAWGLRRNAGTAAVPGTALVTTTRGFTRHEHIDAIGLIHMNGRVYDPVIGRFVQSDPVDDRGIQGLNRYSYVLNNPLSLTDPTGHLSWGEWMRLGINIAFTVATGDATGLAAFFAAGANGFMAGHLQSGTTKGGAWGAFSAIAFHGIGSYFEAAEWAHQGSHVFGTNLNMGGFSAKVLAHSVTGGTVQHLQGGSFGSGFAAAGVTQAFSGAIDEINPAQPIGRFQRVMVAALVGGTASTISGGKFANGAVTAAFSYAFGEIARASANDDGSVVGSGAIDMSKARQLKRFGAGTRQSAAGEGKIPFLKRVGKEMRGFSDRSGFEYCGDICESQSMYSIEIVTVKSHVGCVTSGNCSAGFSLSGEGLHSHGTDLTFRANRADTILNPSIRAGTRPLGQDLYNFSGTDYGAGPGYLATPTGLKYQSGIGNETDHGPY